ncbi:uncharacterized protein [Euphorbia lathyris]|uniref:uncharacterized protein n=1 Tax=Euphorbia lathyris TaxID=212925 RepID=UPI003313DFEA
MSNPELDFAPFDENYDREVSHEVDEMVDEASTSSPRSDSHLADFLHLANTTDEGLGFDPKKLIPPPVPTPRLLSKKDRSGSLVCRETIGDLREQYPWLQGLETSIPGENRGPGDFPKGGDPLSQLAADREAKALARRKRRLAGTTSVAGANSPVGATPSVEAASPTIASVSQGPASASEDLLLNRKQKSNADTESSRPRKKNTSVSLTVGGTPISTPSKEKGSTPFHEPIPDISGWWTRTFGKSVSFSCKDIVSSICNVLGRLPSASRVREQVPLPTAVEGIEKRAIEIINFAEGALCRDAERARELESLGTELATQKSLFDDVQGKVKVLEGACQKAISEKEEALKSLQAKSDELQKAIDDLNSSKEALEMQKRRAEEITAEDGARIYWYGERIHAAYEHGHPDRVLNRPKVPIPEKDLAEKWDKLEAEDADMDEVLLLDWQSFHDSPISCEIPNQNVEGGAP